MSISSQVPACLAWASGKSGNTLTQRIFLTYHRFVEKLYDQIRKACPGPGIVKESVGVGVACLISRM